jgi:mono/diheme cytochrome c family protein
VTTTPKSPLAAVLALAALTACSGGGASDRAAASSTADAAAAQPAGAVSASTAAGATVAAGATTNAATQDGRAVFQRTCATCHQQNGQGIRGAFPPLAASPFVTGDTGRLVRLVLHGLTGQLVVGGARYNSVMPPWKTLSDAELAAVLTYVRSNFGNTAGPVTPQDVAQQRAATAARTTMWTVAEIERP